MYQQFLRLCSNSVHFRNSGPSNVVVMQQQPQQQQLHTSSQYDESYPDAVDTNNSSIMELPFVSTSSMEGGDYDESVAFADHHTIQYHDNSSSSSNNNNDNKDRTLSSSTCDTHPTTITTTGTNSCYITTDDTIIDTDTNTNTQVAATATSPTSIMIRPTIDRTPNKGTIMAQYYYTTKSFFFMNHNKVLFKDGLTKCGTHIQQQVQDEEEEEKVDVVEQRDNDNHQHEVILYRSNNNKPNLYCIDTLFVNTRIFDDDHDERYKTNNKKSKGVDMEYVDDETITVAETPSPVYYYNSNKNYTKATSASVAFQDVDDDDDDDNNNNNSNPHNEKEHMDAVVIPFSSSTTTTTTIQQQHSYQVHYGQWV